MKIIEVEPGSTIVTIELPEPAAAEEQILKNVTNIRQELLEIITRDDLDSAVVKEKLRSLIEESSSIITDLEAIKHKRKQKDKGLMSKMLGFFGEVISLISDSS